jgi:hypothetical protein
MTSMLTGQASKGIHKRLKRHGCIEASEPESFFVEKDNTLESGEEARAVAWGQKLADVMASRSS